MKHARVKANETVKQFTISLECASREETTIPISGRLDIWRLADAVTTAHDHLRRFLN